MLTPLQIGGTEWLFIIFAVVILLFGSKKLPELARALGKAKGEFQRGQLDFEKEIKGASQMLQPTIQPTTATPAAVTSVQPLVVQEVSGSQRLLKVAQELGIQSEGKTEAELKEEIKKALA